MAESQKRVAGEQLKMTSQLDLVDPDKIDYTFPCIRAEQPIGDLFVASIPYDKLAKITYFDVRRVLQDERDFERYLGIQRPLNQARVKEIGDYVNYRDASFPTSIIIAVDEDYAEFSATSNTITIRNHRVEDDRPSLPIAKVARVLDGQHRIAGLANFKRESRFELSVTIFIGADISDQAQIFATVNLEQTKVNKSLVYDLFELARSRSPQKTCHNIAVQLDRDVDSPFYKRIKRLGIASEQRVFQPITQATFVERLLPYLTDNPKRDRDELLRKLSLNKAIDDRLYQMPFRNLFISEKDIEIGVIMFNYFSAVKKKWPKSWDAQEKGHILNRTNGFAALMRFLRKAYLEVAVPGEVPSSAKFYDRVFAGIDFPDGKFTTEFFAPGSAGEARLFKILNDDESWPLSPA